MSVMMNRKLAQKSLTMCMMFVMLAAYSMVTFATSSLPAGELTVIGSPANDSSSVTVNGEPAKSGRTIFSSSTITTPDGMSAMVNMGKAGKIELGPNTTLAVTADGNSISGDLTAGSVSALNAAQGVNIKNLAGTVIKLNSGETATASSATTAKAAKPGPGGLDWWIWAAIIGGAATAIIIGVAVSGDNNSVSPVR